MTGYDLVRDRLEAQGLIVRVGAERITARCPAHDDRMASLSVGSTDKDDALVYCHAGCSTPDVLAMLDLEMADLFADGRTFPADKAYIVEQYVYEDVDGTICLRVTRLSNKGFFQERWSGRNWLMGGINDVNRVLYHVRDIAEADVKTPLYIVEGEKDVVTLEAMGGCLATTNPGGAGAQWLDKYSNSIPLDMPVRIVQDQDEPGRKWAEKILQALYQHRDVRIVHPAAGKDATDHICAGYGLDEFLEGERYDADWDDWGDEVPDIDWIIPGIIARGTLVWAYGAKETAKSMYLLGEMARLSHEGVRSIYYSEEMSRAGDRRRIARFAPNRQHFYWKNGRGLNLNDEDHYAQVLRECRGVDLVVFDSYERVWDGQYYGENKRAIAFARRMHDLISQTGVTVVIIDHTGFPFRDDSGNLHDERKPRGASAKEQQADMSILFSSKGGWRKGEPYRFRIENMKPGRLENPFRIDLEVRDTASGGLVVVRDGEDLEPFAFQTPPESVEETVVPMEPSVPDKKLTPREQRERMKGLRVRENLSDDDAAALRLAEEMLS